MRKCHYRYSIDIIGCFKSLLLFPRPITFTVNLIIYPISEKPEMVAKTLMYLGEQKRKCALAEPRFKPELRD